MTIYTPEDIGNMPFPQTAEDALAKGAYAFVCRSAPYLAGFGFATGNLPAAAGASSIAVACGLPLLPAPDTPVPIVRPVVGGERSIMYYVKVYKTQTTFNGCEKVTPIRNNYTLQGPIGRFTEFFYAYTFTCLNKPLAYLKAGVATPNGVITLGYFCPEFGDVFQITCTPLDGSQDNPNGQPIYTYPLPPGYQYPPGWPDKPYLPGIEGNQPIYPPGQGDRPPSGNIPYKIPQVPLPVIVPVQPTLQVPIHAPIQIPVSITPTANVDVSPTVTFTLGDKGQLTTGDDTPCPCPDPLSSSSPTLVPLRLTFLSKSGCEVVSRILSVDGGSIPDDIENLNFDTTRLALATCEKPVAPVVAVPEWWSTRVGQRPQTAFVFTFETSNSFGYSSLIVPFPVQTSKPSGAWVAPFSYSSGSTLGMVKFKDGSRIQVYCENSFEANRLLDWLLSQMNPVLAGGVDERYVKPDARDIPVRPKHLVKAFYFPTGRKSLSPGWEWNNI